MEPNQTPKSSITNPTELNTSAMQQISLLSMRMKDFIQELNSTLMVLLNQNAVLQKENVELRGKLQVKA
jgi:hypothetical protein